MDTDQLISHARARFDHATARRTLKEKYQGKLIFAHAGGMWRAGPELLTTLHIVKSDFPIVLLDLYENPVKIVPHELFALASERWQEQMNAWLVEAEELNKKR
jgi:hypothetical protein